MLNKPIILNSVRREWRNKSFLFISAFTIFFCILLFMTLDAIKTSETINGLVDAKEILDTNIERIFFFTFGIWSVFLAMFLGTNCLKSDFNSRVIDQILSFPISRNQYFLNRMFGTWFITFLYLLVSYLLTTAVFMFSGSGFIFGLITLKSFLVFNLMAICCLLTSSILSFSLPRFWGGFFAFIFIIFIYYNSSYIGQIFAEDGLIAILSQNPIKTLLYFIFPPLAQVLVTIVNILFETNEEINSVLTLVHCILSLVVLSGVFLFFFKRKKI